VKKIAHFVIWISSKFIRLDSKHLTGFTREEIEEIITQFKPKKRRPGKQESKAIMRNIHRDMWKPQRAKNFDGAIEHFIQSEFPRLGNPKVIDLFCCQIRKFIDQFYPKGEYVNSGQLDVH